MVDLRGPSLSGAHRRRRPASKRSTRSRSWAPTRCASRSSGTRSPPTRSRKTRPQFDATNPSEYPGFGPYDDAGQERDSARACACSLDHHRATRRAGPPRASVAATTSPTRSSTRSSSPRSASVTRASSRTCRRSGYFTIWNEPNHIQFIKPTSQAPRVYRKLVDAAMPAMRANAAPGSKILVGELKPTPRKGLGPATFLQSWLCLDKKFKRLRGRPRAGNGCTHFKKIDADGFAHHPYGPIEIVSKKRDIINLLAIRRLGKALDLAAKAKRLPRGLPIYNTEFGIQSNPPDIFVATSPSRQAAPDQREGRVRLPLLAPQEPLAVPALRRPRAAGSAGSQVVGLPDRPEVRQRPREARLRRLPVPDRRPQVGPRQGHDLGTCSPWHRISARSSFSAGPAAASSNSGGRIHTNSLGYFSAKKSGGSYRFQAYGPQTGTTGGATGSAVTLLGTSRTATPKVLPSR